MEFYNLYHKDLELNVEQLKDYYKLNGFNVEVEVESKNSDVIFKIIDIEQDTAVIFEKNKIDSDMKNEILRKCETYSNIYFALEEIDAEYVSSIDCKKEQYFLIYLFYLYLVSSTKAILYNGSFMFSEDVRGKLNQMLYSADSSNDDQCDLYEIISKCFRVSLEEAKRLFITSLEVTDMEDCIYIKGFDDLNLILNTNTKEYLCCKYAIRFEKLIEFYKEGKRNNEADDIIKQKIKLAKEKKGRWLEEKSVRDGIDYLYILNNELYEFKNRDINDEKTLFMFINESDQNDGYFDGALDADIKILKHKCCTLSVAVLVYNRVRDWAYLSGGRGPTDEDNEYYKFLFNLYNDIKNFKYPVGSLLPAIKIIEGNQGEKYYDYPKSNFKSYFEKVLDFEKNDAEFNAFFEFLNAQVVKNVEDSDASIKEVKMKLKLTNDEIMDL